MANSGSNNFTIAILSKNPYTNHDGHFMKKHGLVAVPSTLTYFDSKVISNKVGSVSGAILKNIITHHANGNGMLLMGCDKCCYERQIDEK